MFTIFNSNKRYDVVTGFGILHYFDKQEAVKIYENSLSMIKENGLMIIKNQFGVDIDVTVDGFSNNIGRNYYSNYRQVNDEINLLKDIGFNIVEKHNIYPSELNKWYNTHYFALVCRK